MCDATAGLLSAIGVLQALRERDRTGTAQWVAADILSGAVLLASDAFVGPDDLDTRPHLDRLQMGLGPLYRLYPTLDGWLCIAALTDAHLAVALHRDRPSGARRRSPLLDGRGTPRRR